MKTEEEIENIIKTIIENSTVIDYLTTEEGDEIEFEKISPDNTAFNILKYLKENNLSLCI